MLPLSQDTPLEVEEVWLALIRDRGPQWSLRRMAELSRFARQAARAAVRSAHPDAGPEEHDRILLCELYGDEEMARKAVELRSEQGFYRRDR